MGNKLCTSANKEDKADAKAEKKENANKPLEKKVEDAEPQTEAQIEAKEVATVEISRTEAEKAAAETADAAAEKLEEVKPEEVKPEEVKPEEVKPGDIEDDKKDDITNKLDAEVVQRVEEAIVTSVVTSEVSASPPVVTNATGDDIREDIVQAVTIETVKLSVTEYIDEAKGEAGKATAEVAKGAQEVVENAIEKYDSPDDKAGPKENFLKEFRKDHKIHAVDFMRIWRNYDQDASGFLEKKELTHFLKDLMESKGQKSDKKTVSAYETIMMATYDKNHDGKLELSELSQLLPVEHNFLAKFPGREKCTREDFNKIFDHFDKDESGSIGHTELLALMKDLFEKEGPHHMNVTDIQSYADGVFDIYDTSQDGRLSKDELALVLSKS